MSWIRGQRRPEMARVKPREPLTAEQEPPVGARAIHLTRGWVAWVDEEDYPAVSSENWCLFGGGPYYAYRRSYPHGQHAKSKLILMHRELLGGGLVDHREHHERIRVVDNRRGNLRLASALENARNARKIVRRSSPYKGVSKTRRWWQARIRIDGSNTELGCFYTAEAAALAYDAAAMRHFGDFAWTNFPREMQA